MRLTGVEEIELGFRPRVRQVRTIGFPGQYISTRGNLRGVTETIGGVGLRIGGAVGGYALGALYGWPIVGAIVGYLIGAGVARAGGEGF